MMKRTYMKPEITKSVSDQLEGVFACTGGNVTGSNQDGNNPCDPCDPQTWPGRPGRH